MAITANELTVASVDSSGKTYFATSFSSADVTGCELIKAAPAAGSIYITHVNIAAGDAATIFGIGSGKSSTALETAALEFVSGANGGNSYNLLLDRPIKLVALKGMYIDAVAACPVAGTVQGFVN